MISLRINHGIDFNEIAARAGDIKQLFERIEARRQGFYTTIDDKKTVQAIGRFAESVHGKYDDIVLLGIGGSALGAICIREALRPHAALYVVDNVDPALIADVASAVDLTKTLFVVVTKSGSTPETLSQYFYFRKLCEDAGLKAKEHFVFITDPEKGLLRKIAREESIHAFDVPENIGGRFSVLTPVGLLPAALIGCDVEKMLAGARAMRERFLSNDFEKNMPFQLAAIQYRMGANGKNIHVMMPYSQRLFRFADWFRQLLAESIGKTETIGPTPINALGVTDQHSQCQLYNDGPNDKFFIFIESEDFGVDMPIPVPVNDESVSYLKNVSFKKLMHVEMNGTVQSLTKNDRPSVTLSVDAVKEETLGELFMLFECATAFLGEFYGINAFDQPGVELGKRLTKEMLEREVAH